MKRCTKCGVEKSLDNFYRTKRAYSSRCKECLSEYYSDRYVENNESMKIQRKKYKKNNRDKINLREGKYRETIKGRSVSLYKSAKARAKINNLDFILSTDFIEILLYPQVCAKSGIRFVLTQNNNKRHPFAPSLDRKQNDRGYTPENMQIVCNMYNSGKAEADEVDFIAMCMAVAEMNRTNQSAIDRLAELRNAARL